MPNTRTTSSVNPDDSSDESDESSDETEDKLETFIFNLSIPKSCSVALSFRKFDYKRNLISEFNYNQDDLHYTASISKLLILLSVIDEIDSGTFSLQDKVTSINPSEKVQGNLTIEQALKKMIESSSNFYSGVSQRLLKGPNDERGINKTIEIIEKYGFGKGKFWVGAGYDNGPKNSRGLRYNHEAKTSFIALYYQTLLEGDFPLSEKMLELLSKSKINNRFFRALVENNVAQPENIWRKSGSWTGNSTYSDSVMFKNEQEEYYIIVLLTQGSSCIQAGSKSWFEELVKDIYNS